MGTTFTGRSASCDNVISLCAHYENCLQRPALFLEALEVSSHLLLLTPHRLPPPCLIYIPSLFSCASLPFSWAALMKQSMPSDTTSDLGSSEAGSGAANIRFFMHVCISAVLLHDEVTWTWHHKNGGRRVDKMYRWQREGEREKERERERERERN